MRPSSPRSRWFDGRRNEEHGIEVCTEALFVARAGWALGVLPPVDDAFPSPPQPAQLALRAIFLVRAASSPKLHPCFQRFSHAPATALFKPHPRRLARCTITLPSMPRQFSSPIPTASTLCDHC